MASEYMWTPLGASAEEMTEFLSLRPGIPDYMRQAVIKWVRGDESPYDWADTDFLLRFQTVSKIDLGITSDLTIYHERLAQILAEFDEDLFANLVHFILSEINLPANGSKLRRPVMLEEILSSGGSSYAVGMIRGRYGLVERIPAAVAETVEAVISSADKASAHLSTAWDLAFGMNKNPSHAYFDAVKAVERYSCALFSPKDKDATLGKDINVLRSGIGKFQFVMADSQRKTSIEHVLSMMELLWHSHTDRHGSGDYTDVTVEQAQAAVLLSSTLVGWLSKGMISRKN